MHKIITICSKPSSYALLTFLAFAHPVK